MQVEDLTLPTAMRPSWRRRRAAAAAAATTTIAATASAVFDAAFAAAISATAATDHHPRSITAGHWPSPPITAGATSTI